jgi:hypothetical protein
MLYSSASAALVCHVSLQACHCRSPTRLSMSSSFRWRYQAGSGSAQLPAPAVRPELAARPPLTDWPLAAAAGLGAGAAVEQLCC